MNYVKKLNLHWFCTQNHILEPFSVRRACTKSYVTSEPYPRASQIWCQNVRETWKKKVVKCRGESFARCRVIARNVEGGGGLFRPPPQSFYRVKLLVVPENKSKFIVFSFRPIDPVVFWTLNMYYKYLLTPFLWMLVQWTNEMHLFHISKKNCWVKIHFKDVNYA